MDTDSTEVIEPPDPRRNKNTQGNKEMYFTYVHENLIQHLGLCWLNGNTLPPKAPFEHYKNRIQYFLQKDPDPRIKKIVESHQILANYYDHILKENSPQLSLEARTEQERIRNCFKPQGIISREAVHELMKTKEIGESPDYARMIRLLNYIGSYQKKTGVSPQCLNGEDPKGIIMYGGRDCHC